MNKLKIDYPCDLKFDACIYFSINFQSMQNNLLKILNVFFNTVKRAFVKSQ